MDEFYACIVVERDGVGGGGELIIGPVLDLAMLVGQELRLGGIILAVFDE